MLQKAGGDLEVLLAPQWVHGEALVGIGEEGGVKPLKNFGLFMSGGQINSLKGPVSFRI